MTGRARLLRQGAALGLAAFVLLTIVPIVPWTLTCEGPVPGPYRPIVIERLSHALWREDVYHLRIGDRILLRVLPLYDATSRTTRADALERASAVIRNLMAGEVEVRGSRFPRPPALLAAEQAQAASGRDDPGARCVAVLRPSPTDPPVPTRPWPCGGLIWFILEGWIEPFRSAEP